MHLLRTLGPRLPASTAAERRPLECAHPERVAHTEAVDEHEVAPSLRCAQVARDGAHDIRNERAVRDDYRFAEQPQDPGAEPGQPPDAQLPSDVPLLDIERGDAHQSFSA